jgi:hypothetical protein
VPVGVLLAITDKTALEAGYMLNWLDDSYFEHDPAHQIILGLTSPG